MSALLLKVARAIERGTIDKHVEVWAISKSVIIRSASRWSPVEDIERGAELLAWVRKEFPGGTERREMTQKRSLCRSKPVWVDRMAYRAAGGLTVFYPREHVHGDEYRASTIHRDRHGNVQWVYECCGQRIGVRMARELGLTP